MGIEIACAITKVEIIKALDTLLSLPDEIKSYWQIKSMVAEIKKQLEAYK